MQITSTNFPQQQTAFKAITVPKECQQRFMRTLKTECDSIQLLRCLQIFEKELSNKNNIILEDVGYFSGLACDGHFRATVNGKEYWNSWLPNTGGAIVRFMSNISNKAGRVLDRPTQLRRKAQDLKQKAELQEFKDIQKRCLKKGAITEEENKHYLLGKIYKMITNPS